MYIGQTSDLEKRLHQHRSKSKKSAKYIRYFVSFELVYREEYPTRQEAMKREWQLIKWPRDKNEDLLTISITCLYKDLLTVIDRFYKNIEENKNDELKKWRETANAIMESEEEN